MGTNTDWPLMESLQNLIKTLREKGFTKIIQDYDLNQMAEAANFPWHPLTLADLSEDLFDLARDLKASEEDLSSEAQWLALEFSLLTCCVALEQELAYN